MRVTLNRCLSVIVGLKIPELLCNSEESSLSIEDIATKSGCTSSKQLYPMMRVLAQWGIGKELENKSFAKNQAMELLRRDDGPNLGHMVAYYCSEEHITAMRSLAKCVRQNKPAFVLEHGMTHFDYMNEVTEKPYDQRKMFQGSSEHLIGSYERRQEFAENYHSAMELVTNLTSLPDAQGVNNVYKAFPWPTCNRLVDMGGSTGYFLASLLKQPGCEHIQGYVVELPDVVDEAQRNFSNLGIPEHRVEFIKQDFTNSFPSDLHVQPRSQGPLTQEERGTLILRLGLIVRYLKSCKSENRPPTDEPEVILPDDERYFVELLAISFSLVRKMFWYKLNLNLQELPIQTAA
ncbi:hypothetical protein QZH41_006940 [Actinostola sp. cb2023]|nr:hypothetical protein QZH41_006940 [Actinostola sp. cb2023]